MLVQLDLSELQFQPYSLRRGGATFEMQSHRLMEKTFYYVADGETLVWPEFICVTDFPFYLL